MCHRDREHHDDEVSRCPVVEHAAHYERESNEQLEIKQAGERRRHRTRGAQAPAGDEPVRKDDDRGNRGEQHEVAKTGVRMIESIHASMMRSVRTFRTG